VTLQIAINDFEAAGGASEVVALLGDAVRSIAHAEASPGEMAAFKAAMPEGFNQSGQGPQERQEPPARVQVGQQRQFASETDRSARGGHSSLGQGHSTARERS
jgi:hypothetical protein